MFIDIETIPLGIDFRKYVTDQLEKCEIVLAIMGDDWLCDDNGPSESTRIELATALERGDLPIIPILVGEAPVPSEDQLPDDLKALSYRNGLKLHGDRGFNQGMQSLIEVIERETEWMPAESEDSDNGEQSPKRKPGTRGLILAAIAAILP